MWKELGQPSVLLGDPLSLLIQKGPGGYLTIQPSHPHFLRRVRMILGTTGGRHRSRASVLTSEQEPCVV